MVKLTIQENIMNIKLQELKYLKLSSLVLQPDDDNNNLNVNNYTLSSFDVNDWSFSDNNLSSTVEKLIYDISKKTNRKYTYIIVGPIDDNFTISVDIQNAASEMQICYDAENTDEMFAYVNGQTFTYANGGYKLLRISDGLTELPIVNCNIVCVKESASLYYANQKTKYKLDGVWHELATPPNFKLYDLVETHVNANSIQFRIVVDNSDDGDFQERYDYAVENNVITIDIDGQTYSANELLLSYDAENDIYSCGTKDNPNYLIENKNFESESGEPYVRSYEDMVFTHTEDNIDKVVVYASFASEITQTTKIDISKITDVKISNNALSIDSGAFCNFSNLTSIEFPIDSHIKSIGDSAFQDCIRLTSLVIPYGVEHIGRNAFASDYELQSLGLPSTIKKSSLHLQTIEQLYDLYEIIYHNQVNFVITDKGDIKQNDDNVDVKDIIF